MCWRLLLGYLPPNKCAGSSVAVVFDLLHYHVTAAFEACCGAAVVSSYAELLTKWPARR